MKRLCLTLLCAVAVAKLEGAEVELMESRYEIYTLTENREKPFTLWDRYTHAVDSRAERTFNRLRPIYSLRLLAHNDLQGPERVNDVAYATISRLLGYGGNVLITESQPYIFLKEETRAFGNFLDASVRDVFDNLGEYFRDEVVGHDPVGRVIDLLPDPEGTNSIQRLSPWKHKVSYGIGLKGGGPSVFVRGRIRYHHRVWAYYDTRLGLEHFGDVKLHNSLMFPLTKKVQLSSGIAWAPLDETIRWAIRGHYQIGPANCVTSVLFTEKVVQIFLGATINW